MNSEVSWYAMEIFSSVHILEITLIKLQIYNSEKTMKCFTKALGRPWGLVWVGWWVGGSGWGTHVNPWLIHVNVWQKPLQYCKVISLQLIKINEKYIYISIRQLENDFTLGQKVKKRWEWFF